MPLEYLLTALWGGQDGSLLWWLFLLSVYIGACVRWLGKKHLELQPYVIATLMAIVLFFCVLMAFAANPFATNVAGARSDGEGLNPLLQNYWMVIHPPCLYTGFVGCSVPFAFAVAALVTGPPRPRVDRRQPQVDALRVDVPRHRQHARACSGRTRSSAGAATGGGTRSRTRRSCRSSRRAPYVHSVMIQERRGLLKVWNVFLIALTFFLTIFGTFLTRSGMIASVHSFAQSSIGNVLRGVPAPARGLRDHARDLALARAAGPQARPAPALGGRPARRAGSSSGACCPGLVLPLAHCRCRSAWRVTLIAVVAGARGLRRRSRSCSGA